MVRLGEVTGAVLLVEDFEDVFGRFLEGRETGEGTSSSAYHTRSSPTAAESSAKATGPEMRFHPSTSEYNTERLLAQQFGITAFREYFGLDPGTNHHAELRTLASYISRTGRTTEEARILVFKARQERLNAALGQGKTSAIRGDVVVACGWMRDEQLKGDKVGEVVLVRGGAPVGAVISPPVRRVKLRLGNPKAHGALEPSFRVSRDISGHAQTSTSSTHIQGTTSPPTAGRPLLSSAPSTSRPPMSAMDELMIQSFKTISDSAPQALEAGQEMTLRIGRNADGSFYFRHDVQFSSSSSRIGYPYRLGAEILDNVDEVLGLRPVLPRPPVDGS